MTQRRRWPDGGCRQRGGRRRGYAAVCRAGFSHLLLGYRLVELDGLNKRPRETQHRLTQTCTEKHGTKAGAHTMDMGKCARAAAGVPSP